MGLTRALLLPGLNTIGDYDHTWFWAWCGELFAGAGSTYFTTAEAEINDLFSTACRAALANADPPPPGDVGFDEVVEHVREQQARVT